MPFEREEPILLRIFVRESELFDGVKALQKMGFEGFTAIKGIMGFGKTGVADAEIEVEGLNLPVVLEIFTTYGKFSEKREELKRLFKGLITIEGVKPLNP